MSVVLGHIRAFRALGYALGEEAEESGDEAHGLLLSRLSRAHMKAADRLEADERVAYEAEAGAGPSIPANFGGPRRARR